MVHNVLTNNDVCENFNDYFAINYHAKKQKYIIETTKS